MSGSGAGSACGSTGVPIGHWWQRSSSRHIARWRRLDCAQRSPRRRRVPPSEGEIEPAWRPHAGAVDRGPLPQQYLPVAPPRVKVAGPWPDALRRAEFPVDLAARWAILGRHCPRACARKGPAMLKLGRMMRPHLAMVLQIVPFAWVGTAVADLSHLAGRWDYSERIDLHCVIEGEVLDDTQSGQGEVVVQQ